MDSEQTEFESRHLPRNDEDRNPEVLVEQFSAMQLNPEQNHFYGKSRWVFFLFVFFDLQYPHLNHRERRGMQTDSLKTIL